MKKYFIMLVMMSTMSLCSFASNNKTAKVDDIEKYEFNINHRRLACTLNLSLDQMEMSEEIMSEFERDMYFAASCETQESRDKVVSNLVKKNIKYMGYILNKEQYHKYLILLNTTLINKGFDLEKINE